MYSSNKYIVHQSKKKQIQLTFIGFMMVLASLIVLFSGSVLEAGSVFTIIGLIGTVFFGVCEVYIIRQLVIGKALVVLTEEGFYDYSSALATKEHIVLWSHVEKIENKGIVKQSFVSVYLRDTEKLFENLSSARKKAIASNAEMGFGEINISLQSAQITNEELIQKMNDYLIKSRREDMKLPN